MKCKDSETFEDIATGDFLWAFSMVRSRSLTVPKLQNQKPVETKEEEDREVESEDEATSVSLELIPCLDLFNHDFESGS